MKLWMGWDFIQYQLLSWYSLWRRWWQRHILSFSWVPLVEEKKGIVIMCDHIYKENMHWILMVRHLCTPSHIAIHISFRQSAWLSSSWKLLCSMIRLTFVLYRYTSWFYVILYHHVYICICCMHVLSTGSFVKAIAAADVAFGNLL